MRRLSLISKPSLNRSNLLLPPILRLFLTLDPKPANGRRQCKPHSSSSHILGLVSASPTHCSTFAKWAYVLGANTCSSTPSHGYDLALSRHVREPLLSCRRDTLCALSACLDAYLAFETSCCLRRPRRQTPACAGAQSAAQPPPPPAQALAALRPRSLRSHRLPDPCARPPACMPDTPSQLQFTSCMPRPLSPQHFHYTCHTLLATFRKHTMHFKPSLSLDAPSSGV